MKPGGPRVHVHVPRGMGVNVNADAIAHVIGRAGTQVRLALAGGGVLFGEVVSSHAGSLELMPWGCTEPRRIAISSIALATIAEVRTHREFSEIRSRQRRELEAAESPTPEEPEEQHVDLVHGVRAVVKDFGEVYGDELPPLSPERRLTTIWGCAGRTLSIRDEELLSFERVQVSREALLKIAHQQRQRWPEGSSLRRRDR